MQGIPDRLLALGRRLRELPVKTVTAILVAFALADYAIEAAGTTVMRNFRIVPGLDSEVAVDAASLMQDLVTEIGRIRSVQDSAKRLEFNLVKGLDGQVARRDGLQLEMSAQVNADYNTLVQHLGTVKLDWGPVKVPAELLMRPLQYLLRQHVVDVALKRDGADVRALATADDGRVWEATGAEGALVCGPEKCLAPSRALLALAYKMAFVDARVYQPGDLWMGFLHFHEGVRHLLEYHRQLGTAAASPAHLDEAADHFHHAVALNPKHAASRYNLLLTQVEQVEFVPANQRVAQYAALTPELKDLVQSGAPGAVELLSAAYVLVAEAELAAGDDNAAARAIPQYQNALALLPNAVDLRTYVENNLGLAYEATGNHAEARRWYTAGARNQHYPRASVNLANLAFADGDFAGAELAYLEILRRWPDYDAAIYNLGAFYMLLRWDGDLESLDVGVQICLRKRALIAFDDYIQPREREEVTRNLSAREQGDLDETRRWRREIADQIGAPTDRAESHTYRACFRIADASPSARS